MAGLDLGLDKPLLEGEGTTATLGKGIRGTGTLLEGRGTCHLLLHLHCPLLDRMGLDLRLLRGQRRTSMRVGAGTVIIMVQVRRLNLRLVGPPRRLR